MEHQTESLAPRRVPHGPDPRRPRIRNDLALGIDTSRAVVREPDEIARLAQVGNLNRCSARQLEHAVAIGAHPHVPHHRIEPRSHRIRGNGVGDREDRREVVHRCHRLAAAAQFPPRVALREQHRAEHVEPLLPVRVNPRVRGRFVDRLPTEHEVAERLRAERDVTGPVIRARTIVDETPLTQLREPARHGEVVKTNPR